MQFIKWTYTYAISILVLLFGFSKILRGHTIRISASSLLFPRGVHPPGVRLETSAFPFLFPQDPPRSTIRILVLLFCFSKRCIHTIRI